MRQRLHYVKASEVAELVAELILNQKHTCGPDCLCWKLRRVPAINEAIGKLHVQKLQAKQTCQRVVEAKPTALHSVTSLQKLCVRGTGHTVVFRKSKLYSRKAIRQMLSSMSKKAK